MYAPTRATQAHTPHVSRCPTSTPKPRNNGLTTAKNHNRVTRVYQNRNRRREASDVARMCATSDDTSDKEIDKTSSTGSSPEPSETPSTRNDDPDMPLKWMQILEESAEWDPDIAKLLDGAGKDPNEVENRIRTRFATRKETIYKEREGSTVPMLVKFNEFRSNNLWIWVESHNAIVEQEEPLIDEVFKAWFVLGKLGGFNSENQQVQVRGFHTKHTPPP